jgi:ribosomal protein L10
VFAPEASAITAARLVREFAAQHKGLSIEILAGVIEGEVIAGADATHIADMPDKRTVRAQLVGAIAGPARSLAAALHAVSAGLARCLDQRAKSEAGS